MNLLQLARKARFEVDAIRDGDVVSDLWSDEEVYSAINTALERAYRLLRLNSGEVVAKHLRSDASSIDFITETYAPSSIRLIADTLDYTLPPDFVSVVQIVPVGTGFDGVRFKPLTTRQRMYVEQRALPTEDADIVSNTEAVYFYTVVGERTLRIVPTVRETIDIELTYNYNPPLLQVYSTGTVGTGGAPLTTVTGTGTAWLDAGIRTPADLVTGTITAPVDINRYYPAVTAIPSNTTLTMAKSQTITDGTAYRLAMAPTLPRQYHTWLSQMAAAVMFRKVNIETANSAAKALEEQLAGEIQPETSMRQMHESIPVEPFMVPE